MLVLANQIVGSLPFLRSRFFFKCLFILFINELQIHGQSIFIKSTAIASISGPNSKVVYKHFKSYIHISNFAKEYSTFNIACKALSLNFNHSSMKPFTIKTLFIMEMSFR